MSAKRHHFVPVCYLREWSADDGMITVYRKDDPKNPFRQIPQKTGFRKYYYSQPTFDGNRDNERLEQFFSREVETKWPLMVQRMQVNENINDELIYMIEFVVAQRVRVPAARDSIERCLAAFVKARSLQLRFEGKIPPPPIGMEDLLDNVEVSIDPHLSIHAMVEMALGLGTILDGVGFQVLHNNTGINFLTSDNPVIYFDPTTAYEAMRPYSVQLYGPISFYMPVTPKLMLHGHSSKKNHFARNGLEYVVLEDRVEVETINSLIVRFAYETVYSNGNSSEIDIVTGAHLSPILEVDIGPPDLGYKIETRNVFGSRTPLSKWKTQPFRKPNR